MNRLLLNFYFTKRWDELPSAALSFFMSHLLHESPLQMVVQRKFCVSSEKRPSQHKAERESTFIRKTNIRPQKSACGEGSLSPLTLHLTLSRISDRLHPQALAQYTRTRLISHQSPPYKLPHPDDARGSAQSPRVLPTSIKT